MTRMPVDSSCMQFGRGDWVRDRSDTIAPLGDQHHEVLEDRHCSRATVVASHISIDTSTTTSVTRPSPTRCFTASSSMLTDSR